MGPTFAYVEGSNFTQFLPLAECADWTGWEGRYWHASQQQCTDAPPLFHLLHELKKTFRE